jgi:hypothetical protein
MDDYDGIYNCNGLKYSPSKIFNNYLTHYFLWESKYRVKNDYTIRTRPFSSCVVHLKGFSPFNYVFTS